MGTYSKDGSHHSQKIQNYNNANRLCLFALCAIVMFTLGTSRGSQSVGFWIGMTMFAALIAPWLIWQLSWVLPAEKKEKDATEKVVEKEFPIEH